MFKFLNKKTVYEYTEQDYWFVDQIINFLNKQLEINRNYLDYIKVYYNENEKRSIVKFKFDNRYVIEVKKELFYLMLDYKEPESYNYGRTFEQSICDKKDIITRIQNNKTEIFYPNDKMMTLLMKKIVQ